MLRGPKTTSCNENNPSKAEVSIVTCVGTTGAHGGRLVTRGQELGRSHWILLGQYPGDEAGLATWSPVTPGHLDPGHTAQPLLASSNGPQYVTVK